MMVRVLFSRLFLVLVLLWPTAPVLAQALIADLSRHIISIRTDFQGENLVLFGSLDEPLRIQDNLIISVAGPKEIVTIREKTQVGPMWMNTDSVTLMEVPSFYSLHTAKPMEVNISRALRQRQQLGLDALTFPAQGTTDEAERVRFQQALIDQRQAEQRYREVSGRILFPGPFLFRTQIDFPENVPTGTYLVRILLVRDNDVVAAQTTPLHISKDGVGADIALYAEREPFLYGLIAVILAATTAWLAALFFRRR